MVYDVMPGVFVCVSVCYLKCPLGGNCGIVLKLVSCRSSDLPPSSSTT